MWRWCVFVSRLMSEQSKWSEGRNPTHERGGQRGEERERDSDAVEKKAATAPAVALYARSSSAGHDYERESTIVDALEALEADGVIDELTVRTWPPKFSLRSSGDERSEYANAFEQFESWAEEHGATVRPPFVVRHTDSAITNERDDILVTPYLFLTVWDDDELSAVYPCCHGDSVTGIEEGLTRILRASDESGDGDAELGARKRRILERVRRANREPGHGRDR